MKRTWEQEKAYCEKRAKELKDIIMKDIENHDSKSFEKHIRTACRYMKKEDRHELFMAYVSSINNKKS